MALTRPRASQIYNLDYKQATRVVSIANVTLAGGAPSLVDGVTLSLNDRILVTGQSTGSQNGIYYVSTLGSGSNGTWTRSTDDNGTSGVLDAGTIIMVTEGSAYADTQWKLTTDNPITIGVTALTFVQNYSANSISSGTSNVSVTSNANVTISAAGTANVLTVSSTGTIVSGTESVTGNITGGNIRTAGLISATGNIYSANIIPTGNIIPTANGVYSLGSPTAQWASVYIGNATLYLGTTPISANNTTNTLSVGGNAVVSTASSAACKAWANFDGTLTGTITPRASYNVTSITKVSTGVYTINFTTPLTDANYACTCSAAAATGGVTVIASPQTNGSGSVAPNASNVSIAVVNRSAGAFVDSPYINVQVFR